MLQITDSSHKMADVAERRGVSGVSTHSMYKWLKRYPEGHRRDLSDQDQAKEMRRLKAAAYFAKQSQ